ncbi:YHS domain-containing (seleno)protein [Maribacter sp. 2304DJ31-5]|uniref:YHS domain-containing (seleno)protein n=1 Tax=Maribacter sp. 2304DJ31-5 TaxID=3386273 RepID=UPI0039BD7C20
MKKSTKIILAAFVAVVALVFIFAKVKRISPLPWGHKMVNRSMLSTKAINGYDAVAYFTENKALLGKEAHSHHWKNADWYFFTAKNKKMFVENPEKYAPQYGGYCAFAISKGFTANSDPYAFEIIDKKLYLFDSESIKTDWKVNLKENLRKCETNWK